MGEHKLKLGGDEGWRIQAYSTQPILNLLAAQSIWKSLGHRLYIESAKKWGNIRHPISLKYVFSGWTRVYMLRQG